MRVNRSEYVAHRELQMPRARVARRPQAVRVRPSLLARLPRLMALGTAGAALLVVVAGCL